MPKAITITEDSLPDVLDDLGFEGEPAPTGNLAGVSPIGNNGGTFDGPGFIARHLNVKNSAPYSGGTKYELAVCPFNPDHNDGSAVAVVFSNGALSFKCHHNGCIDKKWQDVRRLFEPGAYDRKAEPVVQKFAQAQPPERQPMVDTEPAPLWFGDFAATYPTLHAEIVEGILREHETANIIAPPKYGKSWLAYLLGLSVCAGVPFVGHRTTQGNVLIWDNELHPPTIAHRIPKVAEAMGLNREQYERRLAIKHLRGRLKDIGWMAEQCAAMKGQFKLIIIDAFYRTLPKGTDENANADMTAVYNVIDYLAAEAGSAVVLIHHASKGNQANKSVTDTGSGAGAISRAADSHIVLRQHQDAGVVVMETALRSHPPLQPVCLRWQFPIWERAPLLDPTALFGAKANRQPGSTATPASERPTAFDRTLGKVREALAKGAALTRNGLKTATKCSGQTINEALAAMLESGEVVTADVVTSRGPFEGFKLNPGQPRTTPDCPTSSTVDGQRLFPIGVSTLVCPTSEQVESEPDCPGSEDHRS